MWWQTLVLNWLKQFSALVLLIEVHKENRCTTVLNILMGIIAVDVLVLVGWIKSIEVVQECPLSIINTS